tara:strand:+ start:499 stop:843 length:345 start_codon:yes stop_codon:yes gene_type:complete
MSSFSIFILLIILVCFLLVLVVMVQNPKGGGLSSSFGGGHQMGGVQKTSDFLDRSTWILAGLLLILILLSNISIDTGSTIRDSRLLQDNAIKEVIPETIPETIPEVPEEIPLPN